MAANHIFWWFWFVKKGHCENIEINSERKTCFLPEQLWILLPISSSQSCQAGPFFPCYPIKLCIVLYMTWYIVHVLKTHRSPTCKGIPCPRPHCWQLRGSATHAQSWWGSVGRASTRQRKSFRISTLLRGGMYWLLHFQRPRDFRMKQHKCQGMHCITTIKV